MSPADLNPMDRAAFALAFHEEAQAAGPRGLVEDVAQRAMARVQAFIAARDAREKRMAERALG